MDAERFQRSEIHPASFIADISHREVAALDAPGPARASVERALRALQAQHAISGLILYVADGDGEIVGFVEVRVCPVGVEWHGPYLVR